MTINPQLVAEALADIKDYDVTGEMTRLINDLPRIRDEARARAVELPDRASLSRVITGDTPEATRVLALAYAKALHGHGLFQGKTAEDKPVINELNWPDAIAPATGMTEFESKENAHRLMERQIDDKSRFGTLIIDGIYKDATNTTEPDFAIMAEEGGLAALMPGLTTDVKCDDPPVIVLTGEAGRLKDFFSERPELAKIFNAPFVQAAYTPPPPPVISTTLESALKVRKPLQLRRHGGLTS